jgi:hypothetical protein
MLAGQLFSHAQKTPLIARFHEFMDQASGGGLPCAAHRFY